MLVGSIYLIVGQGLSDDNAALLGQLGQSLGQWTGPYIVGGDYNMEEPELPNIIPSS